MANCPTWKCRDGTLMPVSEMSDRHLLNAQRYLERRLERCDKVLEAVKQQMNVSEMPIILLTPQGRLFSQSVAQELSVHPSLMLICGHYEGLDERVCEYLATDEISIGDYVLSGGELAALVVVDAIVRLIPGVLGSQDSAGSDSHSNGLLEYPQYTRPDVYQDWRVPSILLSGNHGEISQWRRRQAILRTAKRRPDLLEKGNLCEEERKWILENL